VTADEQPIISAQPAAADIVPTMFLPAAAETVAAIS
jgi:hypothetical protein